MGVHQKAIEPQAIWFAASDWTRSAASDWCAEHDFAPVAWRTREEDGEVTHHIAVIAQPDEFDPDSFRTIADDFPAGVSMTVGQRKGMTVDPIIKQGTQSAEDPWTFIMSTEDVDRDGDIIVQDGINLRDFKRNPIALFGHNHAQPIGVWENVRIEGKKLLGDLKLAALGTSEFIDTLHKLIEQRILRAVSIGFSAEYDDIERMDSGIKFLKTKLLECSLVSVPANQNALRAKAAKLIPENLQDTFLAEEGKGRTTRARKAGSTAPPASAHLGLTTPKSASTEGRKPMSIAQQIAAKEARKVAIKDRLTELKSLLDVEEGEDVPELSDEQLEEIDALDEEAEALDKAIDRLKKIEKGLSEKAKPAGGKTAPTAAARAADKEKGGSLLVKTMTAALVAKASDRPVADVIAELYGSDDRVKAVQKAYTGRKTATDIADTTTVGWAAELVRNDIRGFLNELAPVSVYGRLSTYAMSLDFGTANSITIPRRNRTAQNNGTQMGGAWVGEAGVIPVKQMALASATLNRYKLAVISTFTEELAQQSTPQIETIIRAAIMEDTALVVDNALLDNSAAIAGVRPAGLLNGVTLTASAGSTAADIVTDVRVLLNAMATINGANPVMIMNSTRLLGLSMIQGAAGDFLFRDEIAQGRLLGVPVIASTTVDPSTVLIVDASSVALANAAPQFMVSDQATLTMANADDTAPTQADDGAGDLGTAEQVPPDSGIHVAGAGAAGAAAAGYTAMNMYQQYALAVRMVLPSSWGLTRTGVVAGLSDVAW